MWYKTGTINLTANNATVTGTGTAWADAKFGVMLGMILLAPDNKLYEVKQVNSNTSLTLNSNYAGSTASGQSYAIITTYEGDISQFSARFAAMLTFFQGSRNDTVSWFTGSGDMTFTKDDGTKLTVPTLAKIQSDYLSRSLTANQHVASSVSFSQPVGMSLSTSANFLPRAQGAWVAWNRVQATPGYADGATEFINHKGTRPGGFNFWNSDGTTADILTIIGSTGNLTTKGALTSVGDQNMQAGASTSNILLRFRDKTNVEKSSIYAQTDTGQLNVRWGGTTYTASFKTDGVVTFPSAVYSGSTELLKTGDYGFGGTTPVTLSSTTINDAGLNQFFRIPANTSESATLAAFAGISGGYDGGSRWQLGWAQGVSNTYPATRIRTNGGGWGEWSKILIDNSTANVIPATMTSSGSNFAWTKLAEQEPTDSGSSSFLFSVTNGKGYGNPGIDCKMVSFSTRGATTTALGARGAQVLTMGGYTVITSSNLRFGTLYNSLTGKWELWLRGSAYSIPTVQVLGNAWMGRSDIMRGITYDIKSTWQSSAPAGFLLIEETPVYTGFNTTTDTNGFIKTASPIVKLYGTGECESNEESQGVTAERVSVGVYKVTGSLGFALEGWNIEVPQDVNGNRLCFVATEAAEDGTITVKVSKRRFDIDTAAIVAGEPMDIPEGRWIDLRLEMPPVEEVQSEPEPESYEGEMTSE
ncbi:TPA: hypothetical protein ACSTJE_003875 [Serratia fonticola]|uniref:phage tail fiber protein n=1 Tax=Serratia fonticola TaxID=47917 RepID=UPI0021794E06|nr:hypothetical protein [Serratia fonticola]CAI0884076.1 Uncharacterised protein [Serratia fonticola]